MKFSTNNFLFFLLLLFCNLSLAQESINQTVRGRIIDKDSKTPVMGVAVSIADLQPALVSVTDADGKFKIEKVPVGRRTLKAAVLGYQEIFIGNLVVTSGKELVMNLEMQEKVYEAKTVEIVAEQEKGKSLNEMSTVSARNFNMEETSRYAGSRGDPARMAANFAGVVSQNDARNDIIVRGNSPIGVLWRVEGIDIPSPNHFSSQGAVGGPISILNNNVLGNSDFMTGAFPAEYGNKNAAVFDLKMRNGNNEKREFTGQVGINGLEFGAEGPLKKEASSYLINYRYSNLKAFDALGINFGVSGVPTYQDVSFKVNLPTDKAGIFSVWGLGGSSNIALLDSDKKAGDWNFGGNNTDLRFGSSMGAAGISHLYLFNNKTSGKLVLGVSGNSFHNKVDTLSIDKKPFETYKSEITDTQLHAHYVVQTKINKKNTIRSGIYYQHFYSNYKSAFYSRRFNRKVTIYDQDGDAGLSQAYSQYQHRFSDNFMFTGGLHFQQFHLNDAKGIEPRAGLKYSFKGGHQASFGYGNHNQLQPLAYYYFPTIDTSNFQYSYSNKKLGFSNSNHFIAAYDYAFLKHYRIKIEAYYQELSKLPIEDQRKSSFSMANAGSNIEGLDLMDSLVNKGIGKNKGVEITLEKFYSNNFYFLLTGSFFDSKYRGSDGVWRNTAFDGGYAMNALVGVEIPIKGQKQVLALDLKLVQVGGNRYIPIDLDASIKNNAEVVIDSKAYSMQHPAYKKIDVKVSYKFNHKRFTQSLFVSLENVTAHKNILRQAYDPYTQKISKEYQFTFFPYGGYRIEF